jgi:hypothetical protein
MKSNFLYFILILVGLFSPLLAESPPSYLGAYRYHTDDEDGIAQSVSVVITQEGPNLRIKASITWTPGAAVELQQTISPEDVKTVTTNSQACSELAFAFTDSFKNDGTAKIDICGDTAQLTLDETKTVEARAIRQYGDYQLIRQP